MRISPSLVLAALALFLAVAAAAIAAEQVKKNAVTSKSIKDESIKANDLAERAVTQEKLAEQAVSAEKLAAQAVTAEKLADQSINTQKLVDQMVTLQKLADSAVNTQKVLDNSLGGADINESLLTIPASAVPVSRPQQTLNTTADDKEVQASCGSGKVVGGGYVINPDSAGKAVNVIRSYAVSATNWLVRAQKRVPDGVQWELTVVANCINP